ncbi:Ldh family oxidoreductase [Priestia filamentosa]|uniref:Ldh family oxidoreductase n=1 Tax=Priestia filamentosa TaxID=1402861 RepID=UPI001FB44576|nr:Ldh family oxidoreductase [Priestia filamentosa]UOE58267.1 Ldh family oxidoreductase [Priestia filamentosa]
MVKIGSSLKINVTELKVFIRKVLISHGVGHNQADIAADIIVTADLRGIPSHGCLRMLPFYIPLLRSGVVNMEAAPTITQESGRITYIKGNRSLGFSTSHQAMNKSIEKARTLGMGATFVSDSTHFGIASYYSMMAAKNNFIGITITNGSPAVVAPGGKSPLLGTNALSIAFPRYKELPLVTDISLSTTSLGNLFLAIQEGREVPYYLGADSLLFNHNMEGAQTIDPKLIYDSRMTTPLGAGDKKAEYKGLQLGLLIDLFITLFFGGDFSFEQQKGQANHLFIALMPHLLINNDKYNNAFKRLEEYFDNYEILEGYENIRIPGQRSNELEKIRRKEGIPLDEPLHNCLIEISKRSKVEFKQLFN